MEQRLIDANALKKALCKMCNMRYYCKSHDNDCWTKRRIDEQPTVDAVPVVRCGECKYHWKNGGDCVAELDFFCADGERKTE